MSEIELTEDDFIAEWAVVVGEPRHENWENGHYPNMNMVGKVCDSGKKYYDKNEAQRVASHYAAVNKYWTYWVQNIGE